MKMEFTDMKEIIRHKIKHNLKRIETSIKWVLFAIISGVVAGGAGTLFYFGMTLVTLIRTKHPWLIFLLPFGGLVIVGCYRLLHDEHDTGTNLVISAIHSDDNLPLKMAPLIFISTLITHLFGGSAGREGAALQLGGSIGNGIGKLFHFDDKDKHIMIMCGMSACFSALFGTPMAAAIFSMEVVSVGIMYYAALVPCVISSLVAHGIAVSFGISQELFLIDSIPSFGIGNAVRISVLAILCAGISILFCVMLHQSEVLYKHFFKNPYVRVFVGGCIVIVLTLLVGNQNYNGNRRQYHRTVHRRHRAPGSIFTENDLYSCHAWRWLQRRRDRAFVFHGCSVWMSVRKPAWLFACTLHRCSDGCCILRCN